MFATENYVQARRGDRGSSRYVYMQKLVTEYQDTQKIGFNFFKYGLLVEAQRQIIANLANFAYDPYNYAIMKELNIIDLFLDGLSEEDEQIVEFAIGGICNCVCDRYFASIILESKANVKCIIKLLSSSNENTLISTLTTLYYLLDYETASPYIKKPNILKAINTYAECDNIKIHNVASCLLTKFNNSVI